MQTAICLWKYWEDFPEDSYFKKETSYWTCNFWLIFFSYWVLEGGHFFQWNKSFFLKKIEFSLSSTNYEILPLKADVISDADFNSNILFVQPLFCPIYNEDFNKRKVMEEVQQIQSIALDPFSGLEVSINFLGSSLDYSRYYLSFLKEDPRKSRLYFI